jgi:hypothetical protein
MHWVPVHSSKKNKITLHILDFNISFDHLFFSDNTVCKMLKPQTPCLLVVHPLSENLATALVYSIRPVTCYLLPILNLHPLPG